MATRIFDKLKCLAGHHNWTLSFVFSKWLRRCARCNKRQKLDAETNRWGSFEDQDSE